MSPARIFDQDLLARLIAFDTTSAQPSAPALDFVESQLALAEARCWRWPVPGQGKAELYAEVGPPSAALAPAADGLLAGGLVLSGHIDCVPASEPDWTSPPFSLTQRNGRLVGRGVADMKGFVALAVRTLCEAARLPLRQPLGLLITSDEEVGCLGAQRFVKVMQSGAQPLRLPRSVLVGEPTELRPVRMHKGHLKLRVTVHGRPAHSGLPHLGINAIERATLLLNELIALRRDLDTRRTESSRAFPECPQPVLNLGLIAGGSAVNIVPERATIDLGARLLPGQSSAPLIDEVQARLARCGLPADAWRVAVVNDSPPLHCPADAPLYQALMEGSGAVDERGVGYASDAGPLQALGLQCVVCGPGNIEDAHRANESIAREQLVDAAEMLGRLVERFCG